MPDERSLKGAQQFEIRAQFLRTDPIITGASKKKIRNTFAS
jgi:hypothetical protein